MNEKVEQVEIEILTPVFIGGNEIKDLKRLDYIYEDNKINVISEEKLTKYLDEKKLYDKFIKKLKVGSKDFNLLSFFRENRLIDYKTKIYKESKFLTNYACKDNKVTLNEIKTFVTDGLGKKYLPGSTLKGMIMNAIKCKFLNNNPGYELYGFLELERKER